MEEHRRPAGQHVARFGTAARLAIALLPALVVLASVGRAPGFMADSVQYAASAASLAPRRRPHLVASVVAGPLLGAAFLVFRQASWGCLLCISRPESTQTLVQNTAAFASALLRSLPVVYDFAPGALDTVLSLLVLLGIAAWALRRARGGHVVDGTPVQFVVLATYGAALVVLRTLSSSTPSTRDSSFRWRRASM
jgi:hypothetical protein